MNCNTVAQDSLQEGVFAQLTSELYRHRPTADDLAYLTGVGMAPSPGEDVTNNDQVRPRRTGWAFASPHCRERVRSVGVKAFALPAGLVKRRAARVVPPARRG
jgi:hypothetical protein